jgi:DNA polymerase elongation subunit (family B)
MGLRVLLLDIETAPNTAFVWGLYDQDVGLSQIIDTSYILCWAAKWLGQPEIHFERTLHQKRSSKGMLRHIHGLMECADMIVTYNGNKFDIPTLNREFLIHGIPPPAPTKLMDLYQHVKRRFRFSSNKMDHVAQELGIGKKVEHEGFSLWVKCMENDKDAWKTMEQYNRNDVVILEGIYDRILPWLPNQGHAVRNDGQLVCPNCGGTKYQQRGFQYSQVAKYVRFQCLSCFHWFRTTSNKLPKQPVKFVSL